MTHSLKDALNQGYILENQGNLKEALKIYEEIISTSKHDKGSYFEIKSKIGIIRCLIPLGNFDEAIKILNEVEEKTKKNKLDRELAEVAIHYCRVFELNGTYQEGLEWGKKGFKYSKEINDPELIVLSLTYLGHVEWRLGEYESALRRYDEAITYLKVKNPILRAKIAVGKGNVYLYMGDFDKAQFQHELALKNWKKVDNQREIAIGLNNLGYVFWGKGDYEKALNYYRECAELQESIKAERELATTLNNLGMLYRRQGLLDEALKSLQRAVDIDQRLENPELPISSQNLGRIHLDRGEYDVALQRFKESLIARKKTGNIRDIAFSLTYIGEVHLKRGDFEEALEQFEKALELRINVGNKVEIAESLNDIAITQYAHGNVNKALEVIEDSLNIRKNIGNPQETVETLFTILRFQTDCGECDISENILEEICKLLGKCPSPRDQAMINLETGRLHIKQRNIGLASNFLTKAREYGKENNDFDVFLNATLLLTQIRINEFQESFNQNKLSIIEEELLVLLNISKERSLIPTLFELYMIEGQIHTLRMNFQDAIDSYNKAVTIAEERNMFSKLEQVKHQIELTKNQHRTMLRMYQANQAEFLETQAEEVLDYIDNFVAKVLINKERTRKEQ